MMPVSIPATPSSTEHLLADDAAIASEAEEANLQTMTQEADSQETVADTEAEDAIERCPVCRVKWKHEAIAHLPCGHALHNKCLEDYKQSMECSWDDLKCPVCRKTQSQCAEEASALERHCDADPEDLEEIDSSSPSFSPVEEGSDGEPAPSSVGNSMHHRLADDAAIALAAADEKEAEGESIAMFGAASADLEAPVEALRLGRQLTLVEKLRLQYHATMGEMKRVKKDKADARQAVHDRANAKHRAADVSALMQNIELACQQQQEDDACAEEAARRNEQVQKEQHEAAWRRQQQHEEKVCAEEAARCKAEWQEWQRRGCDAAAKRRRFDIRRALLRNSISISDATVLATQAASVSASSGGSEC